MEGVQFILGRSGSGKTRRCIDAICDALATGGGEPLILLVPEQATYQAERAVLSHPDIAGFSRLHILSFNRLQFRLESGVAAPEISRIGKQMVLQNILLESAEALRLYGGLQQRNGLAEKLTFLLAQIQQSNCTLEQIQILTATIAAQQGQEMAAAKWTDIALLFEKYLEFFQNPECELSNPDIRLKEAARKVSHAPFLNGATLWVDGFSGFSVQERDLLIELLKVCKNAYIALCLDPKTIDLSNTDDEKLDPFSLFGATEETYTELLRIFKACRFTCKEPVVLDKPLRFQDAPALTHLEANLFDLNAAGTQKSTDSIHIAACGNVRTETLHAARTIRRLVKENQMRYRDIAVVVPDINSYAHYIESAFSQYGLPYFLDRPRTMKTHPLVALIGSALQAVQNGFSLADVLSFLKSDLNRLESHAVDMLENYCRAHDVQNKEWTQKGNWNFASDDDKKRFDEKQLDALRREAIEPLQKLGKNLAGTGGIGCGQFTKALWQLLEELKVHETLAAWSAADASDQQFGHRQLFGKLVELLDEMGAVFGNRKMTAAEWGSILIDAMSTLTIKLIPPTLDQVLVGAIERSRHPDIKAIFLVGATQKQFPVPMPQEDLLADEDYQLAERFELELANPTQTQLVHREYLTYIALTRPSQKLFISYPILDEKGSAIVPWSGIERLTTAFDDVEITYPPGLTEEPERIENESELAQWLCSNMGKDRRAGKRHEAEGNQEDIAAGILDRMSSNESLKSNAMSVRNALAYDNAAGLDTQLTKTLFSLPMRTSVTRLGTFAACPYQHFARYVLRLRKRKLLRFEPMDIGTFYHTVLEAMFKTLQNQKKDWGDLADDKLAALCDEHIKRVMENDTHIANFIRQKAHRRYIISAAAQTLKDFMPTLSQLSGAGVFKQTEAELEFGPDKDVQLTIKKGPRPFIDFSGKIDRLDTADIDGKLATVVFDFKRSARSPNFAGMLYGLDLQLPVYLLAVRRVGHAHAENTTPAGAFYLPIEVGHKSRDLSELGTQRSQINKAKGLFDGRFAGSLDTSVDSGWNRCYNFYTNKEGSHYSYYKTSGALRPEDFAALLSYTEQCVQKLATKLSDGKIDITPYRLGKQSPCTWCDYRPLCRFDWQINDYNILESCNKEDALEKMKGILK